MTGSDKSLGVTGPGSGDNSDSPSLEGCHLSPAGRRAPSVAVSFVSSTGARARLVRGNAGRENLTKPDMLAPEKGARMLKNVEGAEPRAKRSYKPNGIAREARLPPVRTTAPVRDKIEEAAEVIGVSLAEFVRHAVYERASIVLARANTAQLRAQWTVLIEDVVDEVLRPVAGGSRPAHAALAAAFDLELRNIGGVSGANLSEQYAHAREAQADEWPGEIVEVAVQCESAVRGQEGLVVTPENRPMPCSQTSHR